MSLNLPIGDDHSVYLVQPSDHQRRYIPEPSGGITLVYVLRCGRARTALALCPP